MAVMTNKIIQACDRLMAFAFYAMIYFLPISPAIVETLFVVILLGYFVKRGAVFVSSLREGQGRGGLWGMACLLGRCYKPVATFLNWPLAVFVLAAMISVGISQYPRLSVEGFFFKFLQELFTFFLAVETIRTRKRLTIFFTIFFISAAVISTNGLFQYFMRWEFIHHYPVTDGRITSSFKHANDLAGYLVTVFPLLISFLLSARIFLGSTRSGLALTSSDQRWTARPVFVEVLISLVVCFSAVSLGLTFSRAAWIALGAAFLFFGIKRPKVLLIFIPLFIGFLILFCQKMMVERLTNVINTGLFDNSSRLAYWEFAFRIIKDHPILGIGLNAYSVVAPAYRLYPDEGWTGYPHNCYLQMASEMGIIGLSAFLAVLGTLFQKSFGNFKRVREPWIACVFWGALAGTAGFLFHSFFDTFFYSVQLGTLLWLMMGIIVAIQKIGCEDLGSKGQSCP